MRRFAMIMVGLVAVTGCATAQPHLNKGTIMDKTYTRGYWEPVGKCTKHAKGKPKTNNNCTDWKWHHDWHDECYGFLVQFEGKEEDICVSRTVYESYRVGDHWNA